jgi:hypothetical protein
MRFSKALAVAIGLSMAATPVLAQSAAPLSLVRSGAGTQGASNFDNDGYILPAIVIFGILAAAILLSKNQDSSPSSP